MIDLKLKVSAVTSLRVSFGNVPLRDLVSLDSTEIVFDYIRH